VNNQKYQKSRIKKQTMFSVKNKTIIVTGASGVIGTAVSIALAKNGARMILLGRNAMKLQETFNKILQTGENYHLHFVCDVLDINSLEKVREKLLNEVTQIDALINIAGGATPGASTKTEFLRNGNLLQDSFFGVNTEAFRTTSDLNFLGSVYPSKVFGEIMAKQKSGNIINISSMGAIQPLSKSPAYSAGKAAISNFTQWLAVHLSKVNVRVNAIAPGFILTEQNRFLLFDEKTGELTTRGKRIVEHTPQGKLGSPEDLITTILWLLADESSFVTGVIVPVDGGFSAYNGI
jgi:NAD(P)-dependent dehydrogenase (short-subunit alcohol dehydrogenase family)